jgi:hypothetical protein
MSIFVELRHKSQNLDKKEVNSSNARLIQGPKATSMTSTEQSVSIFFNCQVVSW